MTPDGYVRACWRTLERGAPGLNYVDSHGTYYFKACRKCRAQHRNWSYEKKAWVCGRCGAGWPSEVRDVAKGSVQRSPVVDSANERMADEAGLLLLVDRFLEEEGWDAFVYVVRVLVGGSVEEYVSAGKPEVLRHYPFGWSSWQVKRAVRDGRRRWRERLEAADLPVS